MSRTSRNRDFYVPQRYRYSLVIQRSAVSIPMPLSLTKVIQHISTHSRRLVPAALILLYYINVAARPASQSLLTASLSWAGLWIYSVYRTGLGVNPKPSTRQRLSWAAGGALALAELSERAVGERTTIWWTKSLLPFTVFLISTTRTDSLASILDGSLNRPLQRTPPNRVLKRLLLLATAVSLVTLQNRFVTIANTSLGLSSLSLTGVAFVLLEDALVRYPEEKDLGRRVLASEGGSPFHTGSWSVHGSDVLVACLRDVSCVVAISCAGASAALEGTPIIALTFPIYAADTAVLVLDGLLTCIIKAVINFLLVFAIRNYGPLKTSMLPLFAVLCYRVYSDMSVSGFCSASLSVISLLLALPNNIPHSATYPLKGSIWKQLLSVVVATCFGGFVIWDLLQHQSVSFPSLMPSDVAVAPLTTTLRPLNLASSTVHPIQQLMTVAEKEFTAIRARQSKSLADAVAEYRRRYSLPPPPNFDKWYEYAKMRNVQLIDEYDTIHESMLPFWALEPLTLRTRVQEALGFENNAFIALKIRNGQVVKLESGPEWQRQNTFGMVKDFVQFLPDMDVAFNVHDEPRVVVPHDELSQMVAFAKDQTMPNAFRNVDPVNAFSRQPKDMGNGLKIPEAKTTRFNEYAHQHTWVPSRMSCSPNSPSRVFRDDMADNMTAYALGDLGFIYNQSALSDICLSPSLRTSHGFFDRPNAFKIAHELIPIFSQSKVSSYQDILYPSPWYWYGEVPANGIVKSEHVKARVEYKEDLDMDWEAKTTSFWWRGSTTGGFSRDGGWRRQHRQQFVRKINALDNAKILGQSRTSSTSTWQVQEVARNEFRDLVDIKFSGVGQCDPGDCDAQQEFFSIAPPVDMQEAWKYKFLLDIDGNAFSGRFYAFLQSKSVVYKAAIFREWHQEWLKPWVHYIPLSFHGDEYLESVRYFAQEAEGMAQAPKLARQGQDWANKALRNVDLEAWFFRLLLEYGRVIDDNRNMIGFGG